MFSYSQIVIFHNCAGCRLTNISYTSEQSSLYSTGRCALLLGNGLEQGKNLALILSNNCVSKEYQHRHHDHVFLALSVPVLSCIVHTCSTIVPIHHDRSS
jgi:hypothetical protein